MEREQSGLGKCARVSGVTTEDKSKVRYVVAVVTTDLKSCGSASKALNNKEKLLLMSLRGCGRGAGNKKGKR